MKGCSWVTILQKVKMKFEWGLSLKLIMARRQNFGRTFGLKTPNWKGCFLGYITVVGTKKLWSAIVGTGRSGLLILEDPLENKRWKSGKPYYRSDTDINWGRREIKCTGSLKNLDCIWPNPCTYCYLLKGLSAKDCKNSGKTKCQWNSKIFCG